MHIHAALGLAERLRGYYLAQRRLQVAQDLTPPPDFLTHYQSYLAQVRVRAHDA